MSTYELYKGRYNNKKNNMNRTVFENKTFI